VSGSYRAISKDLENGSTVTISKGPPKQGGGKGPADRKDRNDDPDSVPQGHW
jgi:hypothetical protein